MSGCYCIYGSGDPRCCLNRLGAASDVLIRPTLPAHCPWCKGDGEPCVHCNPRSSDPAKLREIAERWDDVPAWKATRPPSMADELRHIANLMEQAMDEAQP